MGQSKNDFMQDREAEESVEYRLRLKAPIFNSLSNDTQSFLMSLGMEVKQIPLKSDEVDEHYKSLRKKRIDSWNEEQDYLFKKRNNMRP